ncbi:MAG: putative multiple-sugar transport system permease YteP [Planctomycetes bacterium ADurb.Bin401]|nr:MAG: putative multiple-sugar transport system permease YteP [Planctomycetes bacterium ADurb.Bin401]
MSVKTADTIENMNEPRLRINWKTQRTAYLFLLPALVLFALICWYPIFKTILFSFQEVSLQGVRGWVGFENYKRMLGNPVFYTVWRNTLNYVLLSIAMGSMVPIVLALMINEMRRLSSFFQTLVYLPVLIPVVVALIVWRQIYAPEGGILNGLLGIFGIEPQLWLQNPALAKPAIVVIMTWLGAGGTVLIYLSGLREIPPELYEAAELDGFSVLKRIWLITLPHLSARIKIMLVLQIIFVSQVFTEPFILTAGGPANSTRSPVLEIYDTAFNQNNFGIASAWSVSMLVILAAFSILYVFMQKKHQEV